MKLLTYKLPGEEKERLGVMSSSEFERFWKSWDFSFRI